MAFTRDQIETLRAVHGAKTLFREEYLPVAGALVASCFAFGIGNTAIGVLFASATAAWSKSS